MSQTNSSTATGKGNNVPCVSTPWGRADAIEQVGEGIFFASTPSHGGYFVPSELLSRIPELHQKRALYWSGSRNWYEEDCEWASVAVAFPHLFTASRLAAAEQAITWRKTDRLVEKYARES